MKTHKGQVTNYIDTEGNQLLSSYLDGTFYGSYTVMDYDNLVEGVEGKDLVYDKVLNTLLDYKPQLKEGKEVTVKVEWDITDDYRQYVDCRVLGVDVTEKQ